MNSSSSEYYTKKSWRTGKTSGWAAIDLEQRRKSNLEPYSDNEPFPPISSSVLGSSVSLPLLDKPFVSVVHNPLNFMTSENAVLDNTEVIIKTNKIVNENDWKRSELKLEEILKECYPWADGDLIDDVLAGVNNDLEQASNILKGMLLTDGNCMSNDDVESEGQEHMSEDRKFNGEISDNSAVLKIIQNYLNSIPLEPEWEEDDVYWVHRKDALKMMRSAARHSKAANDYYLKGEHTLAQRHSLKAKEEWTAANSLNDMAAKSILRIRNANNDLWTLDLHGLHAFEAVRALDDHLRKIEYAAPHVNQLKSTNTTVEKQGGLVVSATTHGSMSDMANVFRRPSSSSSSVPSSWSRPLRPPLQVITGKGNHSRGEASLPLAIRTFLIDNRYQFDETRPGMISVRPKFRV